MVRGLCLVIFLVQVIALLHANEELLKICSTDDLECIRGTTQQFMEKTAGGIPQYGLKAIDPLQFSELDYDLPAFEVSHHLRNLKITGLKKVLVSDFQMDTVAKKVVLTMLMDIKSDGDITSDYQTKPKPKSVSGKYDCSLKALVKISYPYDLIEDDMGVTHYTVGQETYTFELEGVPTCVVDSSFTATINADPEMKVIRSKWVGRLPELMRLTSGHVLDKVVPALIYNLRQAAALLPKSAFFSNL